jgi:hypothetical protein
LQESASSLRLSFQPNLVSQGARSKGGIVSLIILVDICHTDMLGNEDRVGNIFPCSIPQLWIRAYRERVVGLSHWDINSRYTSTIVGEITQN